jgi:TRAP-type C4-dicarboxylate transport system permease large subunit
VGAFLSCVIALWMRTLTVALFRRAVVETVTITASIFLIAIGADLFTRFLVLTDLPGAISGVIAAAGLSTFQLILVLCLIFAVLGMFVEPIGIMLLTLPILLPTIEHAGINLVWLGILIVKFAEIGLLTPPVGLNVIVVKGVVGDAIPLTRIFVGVTWFLAVDAMIVAALIAVPSLATWLPSTLH